MREHLSAQTGLLVLFSSKGHQLIFDKFLMDRASPSKGIQHWQNLLTNEPFPVDAQIKANLLEFIQQPSIALNDIAHQFRRCPIACWHVFTRVNQEIKKGTDPVRHLEQALSLLGVKKLAALINNMPALTLNTNHVNHRFYCRMITCSMHAAFQASYWHQLRVQQKQTDEVFWLALFFHATYWGLWLWAPEVMLTIERQVRLNHQQRQEAERDVLGCTVDTLQLIMSNEWKLPVLPMSQLSPLLAASPTLWAKLARVKQLPPEKQQRADAFRQELENIPSLRIAFASPALPVLLCNQLSWETSFSWQSRHTNRILRLLAFYANKPLPQAHHDAFQQALSASNLLLPVMKPAPLATVFFAEADFHSVLTGESETKTSDSSPGAKGRAKQPSVPLKKTAPQSIQQEDKVTSGKQPQIADDKFGLWKGKTTQPTAKQQISNAKSAIPPIQATKSQQSKARLNSNSEHQKPPQSPASQPTAEASKTPEKNTTPVKQAPTAKPPQIKRKIDLDSVKVSLGRFSRYPELYKSLGQLLEETANVLHVALGFERVVIALPNKQRDKLVSHISMSNNIPLKFLLELPPESPMTQLLNKEQVLWVNAKEANNIWFKLPSKLKQHVNTQMFLLATLHTNKRPIAMIYADLGISQTELTTNDLKYFNSVCKGAARVLKHLTRGRSQVR
ncbi:HDOD domain-containing protein [Zooshikella harenae]|uniref:HDOD domain-containing protein n=1 Tax=Zooshikella harenae TaxID=2827238 RepID=A0ABS5ZA07_9GAMM|nr:HDOD domain-containing protein [Zooshikella harenae]MBU2710887.1 HDOD domain-containing protein [Zooshikella harenae]